MPGTVLILDGTATNRIMLKVQLSAGYYDVVQADRLLGADRTIAGCQPDLIVAGTALPDAGLEEVCALRDRAAPGVPLMIVTRENDGHARQEALKAGAYDAVSLPVDGVLLLARIRRLIRERNLAEDLHPKDSAARSLGLSEAPALFDRPARVAILSGSRRAGQALCRQLRPHTGHGLIALTPEQLHETPANGGAFDGFLIDLAEGGPRLLSDLRCSAATRHAALIALGATSDPAAAEALDLGADDAVGAECDATELLLRLDRQLHLRRQSAQLRDAVQQGLRAAVRDPLTGLYNRRFAMPHLSRIARKAQQSGRPFAVMLADIDHFKSVNDRFGHPTGDRVLVETAQRLQQGLGPEDMLARVGGEEFLIALADTNSAQAHRTAEQLCARINRQPFALAGASGHTLQVTVSIGVVCVPPSGPAAFEPAAFEEAQISDLISVADRALYSAKQRGRDRVSLVTAAA